MLLRGSHEDCACLRLGLLEKLGVLRGVWRGEIGWWNHDILFGEPVPAAHVVALIELGALLLGHTFAPAMRTQRIVAVRRHGFKQSVHGAFLQKWGFGLAAHPIDERK